MSKQVTLADVPRSTFFVMLVPTLRWTATLWPVTASGGQLGETVGCSRVRAVVKACLSPETPDS